MDPYSRLKREISFSFSSASLVIDSRLLPFRFYLRQGDNVFAILCLSVCASARLLTKLWTDLAEIFWECREWPKLPVIQFLGVIRRESWILDHFEIFVTIALKET